MSSLSRKRLHDKLLPLSVLGRCPNPHACQVGGGVGASRRVTALNFDSKGDVSSTMAATMIRILVEQLLDEGITDEGITKATSSAGGEAVELF